MADLSQLKKRVSPLGTIEDSKENVKPVQQVVQQPIQQSVQQTVQQVQSTVVKEVKPKDDANREKYTATMEKTLRRRVKIASAQTGVQFSAFIEQACLEKLEREGL